MAGRNRNYPLPAGYIPLEDKLEKIAAAFKANLAQVANVAVQGHGEAKEFSSEATNGMPKKHVIATAFALCEDIFGKLFGNHRWRCSMSEGTNYDKTITKRVKTILSAVDSNAAKTYDEWPPIEEFMHDFSASTHSIPQLTGKDEDYDWKSDTVFKLLFAAESEMVARGPQARRNAVTRDLVKLCLARISHRAAGWRAFLACGVDG
ncbi:MAG TPA: hypothetical protein VHY91_02665 [Pirellulales bacterium]|jgi:hypothetical protein|nr:hypothetical protein [Pirellulales bacterium]